MSQTGLPSPATSSNPSNVAEKATPQRSRIPMSLPIQKLAAPEIPGYHCHWMRGEPQRIAAALRAGYTFVEQSEVNLNDFGIANSEADSGHSDLGSRVSHVSGRAEDGGAERLYLMKLPQEFWEQDQKALGQRQEEIAGQLRGDKGFTEPGADNSNRYTRPENKNIFLPKRSA